ncbi:hypothetical protein [Microvirga terricola]|uniref:Uncharacterized protein n=1 Tax=Microvirga terricola TaxID=2719797 RepID=A0ABX0VDS0_9HYPH|nr:hypothetical protein [Microvirga terricola]NIX76815.1 hypothetical protein [Microvirga terricola]
MKRWKLASLGAAVIAVIVLAIAAQSIGSKRHKVIISSIMGLDSRSAQTGARSVQVEKAVSDLALQLNAFIAETRDRNRAQDTRLRAIHSTTPEPDLKGHSEFVSIERVPDEPFLPVSMTRIGPDEFLVVNYRNIYLFDISRREAALVQLDMPVPVWSPTAVHYSAFYDRVFIANYTGGDVLVAEILRDAGRVTLKLAERLTHEDGIKGPEGVQVSRGGRFMAIADYDGGALSVFERVNDAWIYRWKRPVVSSHGVAIVGDHVYGSGKTIAKFDLETGKELARVSKIGERPILFATCISEDVKTGDLIGSDAMAGRVFTLTKDLELKETFGANGPTQVNLSMPYCAYRDGDDIYVLSTYQDRVIKIGRDGTRSFEFGGPRWGYVSIPSAYRHNTDMWRGLLKADSPSYSMFGTTVRPSYGSLQASDGTRLLMPVRRELPENRWLFYITTIASAGDWIAVAANSSPAVLVYNRKTGALGSVEIGEWDCWASASSILCPSQRYPVEEIAAKAKMIEADLRPSDGRSHLTQAQGGDVSLLDYWREWKQRVD